MEILVYFLITFPDDQTFFIVLPSKKGKNATKGLRK